MTKQKICLPQSLKAWQLANFKQQLNAELKTLSLQQLPLQAALQHSSVALIDDLSVIILKSSDTVEAIQLKVGLFYTGMVAGCNCADDPNDASQQLENEYCEVLITLNKSTAEAEIIAL